MIAAILATAVVAGGLTFFSAHTATKPEATQAPPPATAMVANVAPAAEVRWPVALQAMGPIAPWQEASIGAQVAGLRRAEIKADIKSVSSTHGAHRASVCRMLSRSNGPVHRHF